MGINRSATPPSTEKVPEIITRKVRWVHVTHTLPPYDTDVLIGNATRIAIAQIRDKHNVPFWSNKLEMFKVTEYPYWTPIPLPILTDPVTENIKQQN